MSLLGSGVVSALSPCLPFPWGLRSEATFHILRPEILVLARLTQAKPDNVNMNAVASTRPSLIIKGGIIEESDHPSGSTIAPRQHEHGHAGERPCGRSQCRHRMVGMDSLVSFDTLSNDASSVSHPIKKQLICHPQERHPPQTRRHPRKASLAHPHDRRGTAASSRIGA